MKIVVIGAKGQIAQSLLERGSILGIEVVLIGRPSLDITDPQSILPALAQVNGDIVVNAAAYTQVDRAEAEPEAAYSVNEIGAGAVARAAAKLNIPIVHISTDYVFDGKLDRPYREDDPVGPLGVYGHSKLAGEVSVAVNNANSAIFRTSWIFSPFGSNFVKSMLQIGEQRDLINVVNDQVGAPNCALDIANILIVACLQLCEYPAKSRLRGVFHLSGQGETTWATFAESVFAEAALHGRTPVTVCKIDSINYPTAARRPLNSRLDSTKFRNAFGSGLPHWRSSLRDCVARLIKENDKNRNSNGGI